MKYQFHFDIRITQDSDVTIATIESEGFDHIAGSAKRHPADTNDPIIGQVVALERMFANLTDHYQSVRQILKAAPTGVAAEDPADDPEANFWVQFGVPPEELA